ncbi:MAG: TlpA family protein disulfide reductase [Acidobacteria bacterium]|nr:TlpA family protein disulfide reductase [Acidobacteriota bacterium]
MSDRQEKFWTAGRVIATLIVAAMVATIGYTLLTHNDEGKAVTDTVLPGTAPATPTASSANGSEANKSTPPAATKKAPPDFEVPKISGGSFKLSDYRGKVVVLDFWATWCPPCRKGIPQLVRIDKDLRDKGVEVVGLHIDDQGRSSPEAIRNFIKQFGINYTVGMASNEMFVAYLGNEESSIPQTLVFDRSGKVIAHLIGYSDDDAAKLDTAINRALASS